MAIHPLPALALLGFVLLAASCAAPHTGPAREPEERFTFVYLVSGPKSGQGTKEERAAVFAGHMSNMQKLADRGDLAIAGPFAKPANPAWRGLYVFHADSVQDAAALAATDPGIVAGEFAAQCHPITAPAWLARAYEHDKAWLARTTLPAAEPGKPPANIRPYVIITADDADRARRTLLTSPLGPSVVWHARFTDTGQGVFVLDAQNPAQARAACSAIDMGPCTFDGWWSTASLTSLRPDGPTVPVSGS